ncbi:hypothetical protein TNCV_425151 [Trichonephila clavipes]|nr:hypothetical protein TNCV_425151 [Trichonephila clavipes]
MSGLIYIVADSKLPIQLQPFRRWKWHHSGYVDRSMAGRQFLNSHPEESQELIPEVYGCASVVSTGPHQLITLHHDERLLLHVPVAVRGPQLRSSGGTCARVGHSARRFFRVVIAAAAARLCRGSDRDERRLAGHQHRFPAAKGTRTHRVHVGLQVKKRGEEFFFNVKRGSHFRPLLPSLPPISPQKNFQTDFCSDFLHCKPFG